MIELVRQALVRSQNQVFTFVYQKSCQKPPLTTCSNHGSVRSHFWQTTKYMLCQKSLLTESNVCQKSLLMDLQIHGLSEVTSDGTTQIHACQKSLLTEYNGSSEVTSDGHSKSMVWQKSLLTEPTTSHACQKLLLTEYNGLSEVTSDGPSKSMYCQEWRLTTSLDVPGPMSDNTTKSWSCQPSWSAVWGSIWPAWLRTLCAQQFGELTYWITYIFTYLWHTNKHTHINRQRQQQRAATACSNKQHKARQRQRQQLPCGPTYMHACGWRLWSVSSPLQPGHGCDVPPKHKATRISNTQKSNND